jgi:hypothetical protein
VRLEKNISDLNCSKGFPYKISFLRSVLQSLVTAKVVLSLLIIFALMMEENFSPERRFLQEPHDATSQNTAFLKKNPV